MDRSRPYSEHLKEAYADPVEAASYLSVALEDGDRELFQLALRNVAQARSDDMSKLATASGLDHENLNRILSGKDDPEVESLDKLLHALGLKIVVKVDEDAA